MKYYMNIKNYGINYVRKWAHIKKIQDVVNKNSLKQYEIKNKIILIPLFKVFFQSEFLKVLRVNENGS